MEMHVGSSADDTVLLSHLRCSLLMHAMLASCILSTTTPVIAIHHQGDLGPLDPKSRLVWVLVYVLTVRTSTCVHGERPDSVWKCRGREP